jgi:ADP-ribose pyrophosphatase YjhB (NUDIX family)
MHPPRFCPSCAGRLRPEEVEGHERPICDACGFVYYLDPKVAVAVIVPYDDGIVLGRRAIDPGRGAWSFPSGYVNRGEVLEEAATREVEEEIGLKVAIDGLVGLYSSAGETVVLAVYAARVVGGSLEAGPEMSEVAVVQPDRLPPMAFSHDRRIIADWQRFRAQQAERVAR